MTSETPQQDHKDHLQEINEELYKRGFELVIKNKTLLLLQELYQTSILALDSQQLAERMVKIIQNTLDLTLVGIFIPKPEKDFFVLKACAASELMQKRLDEEHVSLVGVSLAYEDAVRNISFSENAPQHPTIQDFTSLVSTLVTEDQAFAIQSTSPISASFTYPLVTENRIVGSIWLCLDRPYDTLSQFEQESINSLVNVVALSLDRAFLYQQIQSTNSILEEANNKLKELDASKNEFLSFATHQLRSPLTSLKWGLGAVADAAKDPTVIKITAQLRSTADDMISTVNDLLDISKIEQGGLVMQNEVMDLVEFLDKLAEEFRLTAAAKGLTIGFTTPLATAMISGDHTKLSQVFVNIIDNAIKYTPSGSITVSLRDENNNYITDITDTGPGISPEELVKLFAKFARGTAGKSSAGGSGLGLYLSRKIIELHHGQVSVASPGVGKGSTFTVILPKNGS